MTESTHDEHYALCEQLVHKFSETDLYKALYETHCVTQGEETDNLRKAILVRLDEIRRVTWLKR